MPPPNCDPEEAANIAAAFELADAAVALAQAQDIYQAKLAAYTATSAALAACREGPPGDGARGTRKGRRAGK